MKKLAAITMILLLLGGLAACQFQSTPTPAAPVSPTPTRTALPPAPTARPTRTPIPPLNSPNGPPLRKIEMFTANDGFGLINNALLLTHDAGLSWFSVPMPEGQVNESTQPVFIDLNTIYMVVPAPDGQAGQLYHTNNGGGSWQISPVPFLNGQLVLTGQTAFFFESIRTSSDTSISTIYNSTDNGQTWKVIYPSGTLPSLPDAGLKTGLAFISPERGWIGTANQPQKAVLFKTENGGLDWAPQEIQVPQNITSLKVSLQPPLFFAGNQTDGLLPVDYTSLDTNATNRVFYYTSDGGSTWLPGDTVIEGGPFTFINPKTGWVWGKRGLFFTSDAAQTWQPLPVAFGRSEQAISLRFIDPTTGFLLTTDAKNRVRIYNTHDGGNTWLAINP